MSNASQQIVNKAWNLAHVLRDDGLSYMAYTEQITFLLFLKMADEQTRSPYNREPIAGARGQVLPFATKGPKRTYHIWTVGKRQDPF
jgi:type I restriction-modification system DNA methylase subunit